MPQMLLKKVQKKVRLIVRKLRPIWGKKSVYKMMQGAINPLNYLSNSIRRKTWKNINDSYEHLNNYMGNPTINKISKESTMLINGNVNHRVTGIPAFNNNIFIFLHYKLVEIIEDEIVSCVENEPSVLTKKNETYKADILLKCTGSKMNESFLKDHVFTDYIFVDQVPYITHNCGIDRLSCKFHIVGPDSHLNLIPLVSYPLINQILDEMAIYYLNNENKFYKFINFRNFYTGPIMTSIEDVDFRSYLYLYWKILKYY